MNLSYLVAHTFARYSSIISRLLLFEIFWHFPERQLYCQYVLVLSILLSPDMYLSCQKFVKPVSISNILIFTWHVPVVSIVYKTCVCFNHLTFPWHAPILSIICKTCLCFKHLNFTWNAPILSIICKTCPRFKHLTFTWHTPIMPIICKHCLR